MSVAKVKKGSVLPSNVERAAEIFSEYGDFILAIIRYQVSNNALAYDVFQDFFLSLVSRPLPAGVENIKSYLYRAITNDIIDAVRRVEKHQAMTHKYAEYLDYSINKSSPENALIEIEETNKMFKLIKGRLPCSEAQAITLRYRNSYNVKEVAKKMHVDNRTVSRYISSGLSKVGQFLQGGRRRSCDTYGGPELAEEGGEKPTVLREDIFVGLNEEVFREIFENVIELESASDDKAKILYYLMELETSLGKLEERARATSRKYEGRLSASLRDICRVHDPKDLSVEQIKRLAVSTRALINGWGKLNREKASWIRSRLLEVGLTWLPITDKAAKDITKAETLTQ